MGFLGSTDPDLFPAKIEITGYPRHHIQGSGGAPIKNNLSHLQSIKPLFQTVYLFAMKKFLLFAFAAVMLGFAGCNDDENKDNIPPTLREYEAPVFMYGKTREEVKASPTAEHRKPRCISKARASLKSTYIYSKTTKYIPADRYFQTCTSTTCTPTSRSCTSTSNTVRDKECTYMKAKTNR